MNIVELLTVVFCLIPGCFLGKYFSAAYGVLGWIAGFTVDIILVILIYKVARKSV
jgi:hypothetical protein